MAFVEIDGEDEGMEKNLSLAGKLNAAIISSSPLENIGAPIVTIGDVFLVLPR